MMNNAHLQEIADLYCGQVALSAPVRGHNVEFSHETARAICLAYDNLPSISTDKLTIVCYKELAQEILAQFHFLVSHGYTFHPWQADGQPYANSKEMRADVATNKHLYFFIGGEMHPYLGDYSGVTLDGIECSVNDIFRAVHDLFGHACEGFSFSQRGEENAWIHHSMMFHRHAQRALTTETRGQNSWFNESDANKNLPASQRAFPQQKAIILPLIYTQIPIEIEEKWCTQKSVNTMAIDIL